MKFKFNRVVYGDTLIVQDQSGVQGQVLCIGVKDDRVYPIVGVVIEDFNMTTPHGPLVFDKGCVVSFDYKGDYLTSEPRSVRITTIKKPWIPFAVDTKLCVGMRVKIKQGDAHIKGEVITRFHDEFTVQFEEEVEFPDGMKSKFPRYHGNGEFRWIGAEPSWGENVLATRLHITHYK